MDFCIADTFTASLTRLTNEEQKAVKTTAFDLQINPASPGHNFEKLDKVKDKNFCSIRASRDIRIIVHKTDNSLLLCYVDHHDKAYAWAERRKLEIHPKTGAAQLIEIRETVKEVVVPVYVQKETDIIARPSPGKLPVLSDLSDDELLGYGVPREWLVDIRKADEDTLLYIAEHLPAEAAEALLELATGGKPAMSSYASSQVHESIQAPYDIAESLAHPDAQRRFRIITSVEELQVALEYPWEKWTVFLHPKQRRLVEAEYPGPVRVSGSAGTGKSIVALHRAAFLARSHPDARVLLTTFSDTLANALHVNLKRLLSSEPRLAERIDVYSLNAIGMRLYKTHVGIATIAGKDVILELIRRAADSVPDHKFSPHFLLSEWYHVVDAWQIKDWESYRDAIRLGRKTRLPESKRVKLWSIFDKVLEEIKARRLITYAEMFTALADSISRSDKVLFDYAVIDEAQDISVAHVRFLAALGGNRPNALFFTGDLGQRIFQQPFSWKTLGVNIQGRSYTLHVNYRTSHQIRMNADRLLDPVITDIDGNAEKRNNTVSVFNGPPPMVRTFKDEDQEIKAVAKWIAELKGSGVLPHEIGIFVRSEAQLERARKAVEESGLEYKILDEHVVTTSGHVSVCTMHLAKGLEFRAVVVMACDDEVIPLQERIEALGDDADLEEVYNTERQLLYVACTRARDFLLVTSVEPGSEFIDDMQVK